MRERTKKYRGSHTHGRGSKKKGRGKGEKGGKGFAGKHKHLQYRYGKRGFVHHGVKKKGAVINVGDLINFEGKEINLKELGYKKLLGAGKINKKVKVIVSYATEKAIEKIKSAGGEVITD
ncbi:MAG: mitochondrial large ribosomal subunit protein uL15m [Thermoplasmata archaeon]|nr:MAG: mitochondrial large ribosomal subunit protein uL15m [Thermoplasmata archaeon]